MEKEQAIHLANLFDLRTKAISSTFEINKLITRGGRLPQFHQWTNDKSVVAGYNVMKLGENNLYFLFIDWHRNDNYYLVIYSANKSTTYAEIQQIVEYEGHPHLLWKYNPLKRDGKNQQRKAYFKQVFGSTFVHIPMPTSSTEVDTFLNDLFKLSANRLKADRIPDVFPLLDLP
jgi:hypothetical protein